VKKNERRNEKKMIPDFLVLMLPHRLACAVSSFAQTRSTMPKRRREMPSWMIEPSSMPMMLPHQTKSAPTYQFLLAFAPTFVSFVLPLFSPAPIEGHYSHYSYDCLSEIRKFGGALVDPSQSQIRP
jgi:hypothetical protein